MFFEQNQILTVLNCSKCTKEYDEPRMLPCGNTVCNDCITALTISKNPNTNMFDCAMCLDEHLIPVKGFPLNKTLMTLIGQKPKEVYRGKVVEEFKLNLESIYNKKDKLKSDLNNGEDTIKQHCMNLRCDVHASADTAILRINELADSMIEEINKYETECISSFQTSCTGERQLAEKECFEQTVDQIESFHREWSLYLSNLQLDEESVAAANVLASSLKKKASYVQSQIKNFIYGDKLIWFELSSKEIDVNTLGSIKYSQQATLKFKECYNLKKTIANALPESIVVDIVDNVINIFHLADIGDKKQIYSLICNKALDISSYFYFPLKNVSKMFKKYNNKIIFMDDEGIIHILNTNLQDILSGKTNLKEASLLCMNEENVYCLLMQQHKVLIQSRVDKNIRRFKYESTDSDKPFYFPSDIKQFECADGKFIWLNNTKLRILNEKSGEVIKTIDVTAD